MCDKHKELLLTDKHAVFSYEVSGKSIFGAIPVLFEVIGSAAVHRAQTRAGENLLIRGDLVQGGQTFST